MTSSGVIWNVPGKPVGNREQFAVEVHRGLGLAGGSGVDGEKSDIVTTGRHGVESDRLGEGHPVELRIVAGGAVEADDLIEESVRLGAHGQIVHDPGVAKSEPDTGLVDNRCQLPGTQLRRGVHGHCPRLGNREPATHHGRIVGGTNQHPVARFQAEILAQNAGQTIRPVSHLPVGPLTALSDDGNAVAESCLHHPIAELEADVDTVRVVDRTGQDIRP